jgi:hypothetical protein
MMIFGESRKRKGKVKKGGGVGGGAPKAFVQRK